MFVVVVCVCVFGCTIYDAHRSWTQHVLTRCFLFPTYYNVLCTTDRQPEMVPGRSATTVSETTTAKGSAESLRQVAAAVVGSTTNGIHHNAHIHHASQVASDPMLEADAVRHGSVVLQQRSPVGADPRDWKVRPGYSSGASSFCSEDDSGAFADGAANDLEGLVIGKEYLSTSVSTGNLSNSKHSHMLDTIRQEIAAEEDIAPKVVRIEVSLYFRVCACARTCCCDGMGMIGCKLYSLIPTPSMFLLRRRFLYYTQDSIWQAH